MSINKRCNILLLCILILVAACIPTTRDDDDSTIGGQVTGDVPANESTTARGPDEMTNGTLAEASGALNLDAAAFAEQQGLSLEEANQRLAYQESIGEIQPLLMADLPTTFGGLWVEHQPAYRIVIALTEGDEETILPYIEDKEWASFVEVRLVDHTLEALSADQAAANRAVQAVNVAAMTSVDIINNRVELMVGNPELLQDDLEEAGIVLPETVVVMANDPGGDLPDTNRGVLSQTTTADGRIIYLPRQAPTNVSMMALMEGTLLEINGCLRLADDTYTDGFLVIWPHEAEIRVDGERIEVINGEGQVLARVGENMRAAGGAIESQSGINGLNKAIPGMPVEGCSGPYWVAGELETLAQQLVPDIYFEPFSSGGRILAWYVNQSRSSLETETLSGELQIDDDGCLRVEQYLIIWPPGIYLREEPLRIVDSRLEDIALVGDTIQITGGEKSANDYRYFNRKVHCVGPYWGVNTVSITP